MLLTSCKLSDSPHHRMQHVPFWHVCIAVGDRKYDWTQGIEIGSLYHTTPFPLKVLGYVFD